MEEDGKGEVGSEELENRECGHSLLFSFYLFDRN
jgi:hypothetical protein